MLDKSDPETIEYGYENSGSSHLEPVKPNPPETVGNLLPNRLRVKPQLTKGGKSISDQFSVNSFLKATG